MAGEPMPRLEDESKRTGTPAKLDAMDDESMVTLSEEAS